MNKILQGLLVGILLFCPCKANSQEIPNKYSQHDIYAMQAVIYGEAQHIRHSDTKEIHEDSFECYQSIAEVVLNRVKSSRYPNTIEEVVLQPNQFSIFNDAVNNKHVDATWKVFFQGTPNHLIQMVTLETLADRLERLLPEGTLHYHATWVSPYWAKGHTPVAEICGHVFYNTVN